MRDETKLLLQRVRREVVVMRDAADASLLYIDNALSKNEPEEEDVPEPPPTRHRREWQIGFSFEMEPGKFASQSALIAVPCFESRELVISACSVDDNIDSLRTYEDVRVHQIIIDDKVQPFRNKPKKSRPTGNVRPWRIQLYDIALSYRTVAITLQNTGKVKRRVDVVFLGYARNA